MVSPYVPHAIYGMAILSISIHLVNAKKTAEEDRTRLQSRESILTQIRDQLKVEGKGVNWEEVDRLKRLARPVEHDGDRFLPEVKLSWTDVFYGRKLPKEGDELSEWEKKDLEKRMCSVSVPWKAVWCANCGPRSKSEMPLTKRRTSHSSCFPKTSVIIIFLAPISTGFYHICVSSF